MALPYPYLTDNANHINTGSYFDESETKMFVNGYGTDLWYGFGETDVIELSAFDLEQNPIGWKIIYSDKQYKTVQMTYQDALDRTVRYTYQELLSDFILYKNTKILVNPLFELSSSFGLTNGSYLISYNFTRQMAGSPTLPLVVKEISPSRREIKLIPVGANTPRYEAFCKKKFQVKDVAPLLLQLTNQCPYSQIYNRIKDKYAKEIEYLKQLLFLTSDGALLAFLKTIYEDSVIYTNPSSGTQPVEKIKRIQGIRNYYQNLLLSNHESISDFFVIDDSYDAFVVARIEQQFKAYGSPKDPNFDSAKQFLIDFFTVEFYHPITLSTKDAFDAKYYSFFKNALDFGNNNLLPIIDHTFLDERVKDSDPLTLVIKLKKELPEEVKIQNTGWISNISIAPFVINVILRTVSGKLTVKIAPPNFTVESDAISLYNINESYTAADLRPAVADQQTIKINKQLNELQVDYTNFTNFVVFSSAQQRLANFKNKAATWYVLSSSLETLEANQSAALVSGSVYPQYSIEKASIEGQMTNLVNSFDGYESYLFGSGSYAFDPVSNVFYSASYVKDQDYTASLYDKANRDSLINNTPDHIVLDSENEEYLMFLNMVGHFFDNLYLYITNLPSERVIENSSTRNFSKKMVDYMLETFGWKLDTTYEDLSPELSYTTASSAMSAEDRTRAIRTRVLNTLPQIYKTKGTEEAIQMLLSCYGVPSNLMDIREYGNNDYSTASLVTYTKRERSCMLSFSGSVNFDWFTGFVSLTQTFAPRPDIRTFEFKALIKHPEIYTPREKYYIAHHAHSYYYLYDVSRFYHNNGLESLAAALGYYGSVVSYPAWRIGFYREYGYMGRIFAELPMYSASLYSAGENGTFSGSFFGNIVKANGTVAGAAFFSSSYFSGSVDGGGITQISGSISGSVVNGTVTGSIRTFLPLNFNGTLTGSVSTYLDGTFNKTGEYLRETFPQNSRISYQPEPRIFLTSSLIPILDGDVFNVRLRRNAPDPKYQYSSDEELVPTVYDLTVQRNEKGRQIFRSIDSQIGHYEDNMIWDGKSIQDVWDMTGSLGNSVSSSLTLGGNEFFQNTDYYLGNIMVWDAPIGDGDFEIHCNDFSSFSYSGSDAEKHLITRVDFDEPYWLYSSAYYETWITNDSTVNYEFGISDANIPNKSEYYPTYHDAYLSASDVRMGAAVSGSWTGAKTGSLYWREKFTGSLKGNLTSSGVSGSGQGWFFYTSSLVGTISGTMSGSFNGTSVGGMNSVGFISKGRFGHGIWTGSLSASDTVSQSIFTGSFSGSATGSFFGQIVGDFTGIHIGSKWLGTLTGSATGSMRTPYATGTFNGIASGSSIFVQPFGAYTGTVNKIWYGTLTGSHTGSFTGSTGFSTWTGSSLYTSQGASTFSSKVWFSGSLKGTTSSSYVFSTNLVPYASGTFSGSFLQAWTGSPVVLYNESIGRNVGDPIPTSIIWSSYGYPLNYTRSSHLFGCAITYSTYIPQFPYDFLVLDLEKTYTTPNYGPNRFKNEKVKPKAQAVATRFDDKERSTYDLIRGVQSDSNLLGLYLDPQDAKNRDIVKFCGNNDVVGLIADPANMYSASYTSLKTLNEEYNSFGNRKVLYNELITLYKIYFNRSLFEVIKNIIPARASVRTGILVEPTVLERPKYQNRPIASEIATGSVLYFDVTASHYTNDPVTKLVRFSGSVGNTSAGHLSLLYGEFNWNTTNSQSSFNTASLPANPLMYLDVSYINEANFIYPKNYGGGYISDLSDNFQFGQFASLGGFYPKGKKTDDGSVYTFLVKKWNKYTIFSKSGSYTRTSNKSEDVYVSNSIWLYQLVSMTPDGYNNLFYTSSKTIQSGSIRDITILDDVITDGTYYYYVHRENTAVSTPNLQRTHIQASEDHIGYAFTAATTPYVSIAEDSYFEIFGGYPRNHYIHKRMQFSPVKFKSLSGKYRYQTAQIYIRGSQNVNTTIDDQSGLEDASLPVQSIQTSNVNLVKGDNVINQ